MSAGGAAASWRSSEVREALEQWLGGYCYEYGRPERIGIYSGPQIAVMTVDEPDSEHHASVECFDTPVPPSSWEEGEPKLRWMPVEVDADDLDVARRIVRRLVRALRRELGYTPVVHFTGCRGYRVWVLLREPVPSSRALGVWRGLTKWARRVSRLIDLQQCKSRAMARLPYTVNKRCDGYCVPVDPWRLQPLEPRRFIEVLGSADVVSVGELEEIVGSSEEETTMYTGAGTPRRRREGWEWAEKLLEVGLPDARRRVLSLTLARYLRQYLGASEEECVEMLKQFVEASCRNWGACTKIYDSYIRAACRYAVQPYPACGNEPCRPWSLEAWKRNDAEAYEIIMKALSRVGQE